MTPQTPERLAFNRKETARILGLSENTLVGLLRQGRLQHVRVGRRVLISPAAIDRFLSGVAPLERLG